MEFILPIIAVPLLIGVMWLIFKPIEKVAETVAKAAGQKKDGAFGFFIFFLIIFLLLAYSTAKNR